MMSIFLYLFLTDVDKPDVAYYKSNSLYYCTETIDDGTNTNFKSDLIDSVEDSTDKLIFQKLSDNMPRFNRIYVDINGYIPDQLLLAIDTNRLSIVLGSLDDYSAIGDSSFWGASTNSFDFRNRGEEYLNFSSYSFCELYAPTSTFVIPNVKELGVVSMSLDGLYFDTVEILSPSIMVNTYI